MPSFWDFLLPQAQAGIEGAKTVLNEGDEPQNREWADRLLDSAQSQLNNARSQTLKQIEDRNSGSYDPDSYDENGSECSKYSPRHPDYEDVSPPDRTAHRRNVQSMEDEDDW